MAIEIVPEWMTGLENEDIAFIAFIKKFLQASGSLKEVARHDTRREIWL